MCHVKRAIVHAASLPAIVLAIPPTHAINGSVLIRLPSRLLSQILRNQHAGNVHRLLCVLNLPSILYVYPCSTHVFSCVCVTVVLPIFIANQE